MRYIEIALRGQDGTTLCIGEDNSIRRCSFGADVENIEYTSFFKLKKKLYQIMLVIGFDVDIYKTLKSEIKNFSDLGKWSIAMYGI